MKKSHFLGGLAGGLLGLCLSCTQSPVIGEITLTDHWTIHRAGEEQTATPATVPSTVLGALCEAGIISEPFFGKNLESIPKARFDTAWWYRTTFDLPRLDVENEHVQLFLDGVNYRANVWLNGRQILSADTAFGAFRQFDCDITSVATGSRNALAVEVIPPAPGSFYMGFVDWAPAPPDRNMGLFRPVRIRRSGKASIRHPFVTAQLNTHTLREAGLLIAAELTNHGKETKLLTLEARTEDIRVEDRLTVNAGETVPVRLSPDRFEELLIREPRLWWPNGLGSPELYTLHLSLKDGNTLLDTLSVRFGIRSVETYLNEQGARGYKINGRNVLIKGAGWVDDLFLRNDTRYNRAQIRYVKEMNLNALRFEGFWGTSREIYDLCDENGILLMAGWSCQWEWPDYLGLPLEVAEEDLNKPINEGVDKYGVKPTPAEEDLLVAMFRDQVRWLRNHPSIFVWAVGSDAMPGPALEKRYRACLEACDSGRSLLVSAGAFTSELSGPVGMKMNGPYEYVPPVYWYEDRKLGGAFGFNTETGPGPQIPPIGSLRKMIPPEALWPPQNDIWDFHSGRKDFNSVGVYLHALNERYGQPENIEELAMKAQWLNYESIRPMFEAFVVNRPVATGVIQWQLNSAWPEFYWQLYDWYLMPSGAFFGTKKACRPVNIIYNYHDRKVYVANDTRGDLERCTARIALYDSRSELVYVREHHLSVKENTSVALETLPPFPRKEGIRFLELTLRDAQNPPVDNFYWLSGKEDRMDWEQYYWYYTPQKEYADLKALNSLPQAAISALKRLSVENGEWVVEIDLNNTGRHIAFCMELLLVDASDEPVLPVYWDDNYVSLPGGARRKLTARCSRTDVAGPPSVLIRGVNIPALKR
ncbi:MAG: glycoside hydrolase family 2 [Tannerella sp.]|jgi:exo-1,4-beta-D-glucosaminidase|nr:glycoside hydrolase family 2 [Tannerella sp.]